VEEKHLLNPVIDHNFFFRVNNVAGSIILEQAEAVVMPGDNVVFKVELAKSVVINVGLRFVIREGKLTIGAGIITEL